MSAPTSPDFMDMDFPSLPSINPSDFSLPSFPMSPEEHMNDLTPHFIHPEIINLITPVIAVYSDAIYNKKRKVEECMVDLTDDIEEENFGIANTPQIREGLREPLVP